MPILGAAQTSPASEMPGSRGGSLRLVVAVPKS